MSLFGFKELDRDDLVMLIQDTLPIAAMYGRGTLGPQGFIFTHVVTLPQPGITDLAYARMIANEQNRGAALSDEDLAYIAAQHIDEVQVIEGVAWTVPEALDLVLTDPRLQGAQITYELGELRTIGGSFQEVIFTVAAPAEWAAERLVFDGVYGPDWGHGTGINTATCAVALRVVNTIQPPVGASRYNTRAPNTWTHLVNPDRASGHEIMMQVVEPHLLGQAGIDELAQLLADLLGRGAHPVTYT